MLLAGWLLAVSLLPWDVLYWREIRSGDRLVLAIESFERLYGRLPDADNPEELIKLGFELRTGYYPDYNVTGKTYELSYSMGFDGPTIKYLSADRKWACDLCR